MSAVMPRLSAEARRLLDSGVGKPIGDEGGWGDGKSTIVKPIARRLSPVTKECTLKPS